ncbi:MAG: magnesium/cobalt transporter CorA [Anaerolineae bacterium]|nr:magnesium/cobalt transporter CorA [Anaerolineae bacterium]
MLRILHCIPDGRCRTDLQVDELAAALQTQTGVIWVDLNGASLETSEAVLRGVFHFHPLAIEDALQESNVPKVDDWHDYLYLVLYNLDQTPDRQDPRDELDIFVSPHYLVTYHPEPIPALEKIWQQCVQDRTGRLWRHGADYLLYHLADELVKSYTTVAEQLEDRLDTIENEIFNRPAADITQRIFGFKRELVHLRRIIAPQRDVFLKLSRDNFQVIDAVDRIFFSDLSDHINHVYDLVESLRDRAHTALDTHLSMVNNRMNDVMKLLAVITTLFLPLTFITGFFGMNFFEPIFPSQFWTGPLLLRLTLGSIILVPVAMFWWMRRRSWL